MFSSWSVDARIARAEIAEKQEQKAGDSKGPDYGSVNRVLLNLFTSSDDPPRGMHSVTYFGLERIRDQIKELIRGSTAGRLPCPKAHGGCSEGIAK
jgi:hypothetical protein